MEAITDWLTTRTPKRTTKLLGTQASCLREAGWKPASPVFYQSLVPNGTIKHPIDTYLINSSIKSNAFSRVAMLVANEARTYPSQPKELPMTVATHFFSSSS